MNLISLNTILIIGILIISAILLFVYLTKHFEYSLFLALIATPISAFFVPNVSHLEAGYESTIGSYIRIILIAYLSFISVIKLIKLWNSRIIYPSNPFFLLVPIFLLAFFSATYSIDQNITLIRSATFLLIIIYCIGIYFWLNNIEDYDKLLNVFFLYAVFFAFVNLAAIIFLPSKAWWATDPSRLQGVLSQPNSLGADSRDLVFVLFWKSSVSKSRTSKLAVNILIGIFVLFILLSGSRTSLFTLVLGLFLWFVLNKKGMKIILFSLLLVFLSVIFPSIEPSNMERNGNTSLTDLTGRQEFWINALTLISEKPWSGYGFEVGGKVWEDPRFNDPKLTLWSGSAKQSLHNGYITTAIGIGIPGLLLWLLVIVLPLLKIDYRRLIPEVSVLLIIFLIMIITNFVESVIGAGSILFWVVWTLLVTFNRKFLDDHSANISK